ncbi:coenzyme A pyrophosphatase [Kordiimonas sediminis]|uniref:Coenzyme A pyrophosphatase n=1 Tax=Kordiimonas sediminis TaxID=1735581 RepID=A0A919ARL8_9PROT|nr:CoA pyrophosphatase [Kordiimonas sediminis]GHF23767.1 coenzyme A pyrophosphatase [Kordiimonas sediminis]
MRNWVDRALSIENPAARGMRSDADLEVINGVPEQYMPETVREAAVLIPIVERKEPTILLTKRTEHLRKHAGQVSFPGGAADETDRDPVHTALREAEEEIGLDPSIVDIRGNLDQYRTGTGFVITPIVSIVQPDFTLTLEPNEVEAAFEVPLDFILDRTNHQLQTMFWRGRDRTYYTMPYGGFNIWGATAAMLVNLCDVMEEAKR